MIEDLFPIKAQKELFKLCKKFESYKLEAIHKDRKSANYKIF